MIEGGDSESKILQQLSEKNNNAQIVLLPIRVNLNCLKELGNCEHFDVVIACSVIHHFSEDYNEVLRTIVGLGDQIIIEHPMDGERACNQDRVETSPLDLNPFHHELIARTASHVGDGIDRNMYLIRNQKKQLDQSFFGTRSGHFQPIEIDSNEREKWFISPRKKEKRAWVDGINWLTFLVLGGTYPTKNMLLEVLKKMTFHKGTDDMKPWNLVLSRGGLEAIDLGDPDHVLKTPAIDDWLKLIYLYEVGFFDDMCGFSLQAADAYNAKLDSLEVFIEVKEVDKLIPNPVV